MKRLEAGIKLLLGLLGVAVTASWMQQPVDMSLSERMELREEVLRAYSHAYGSYMAYACECDMLLYNKAVLVSTTTVYCRSLIIADLCTQSACTRVYAADFLCVVYALFFIFREDLVIM